MTTHSPDSEFEPAGSAAFAKEIHSAWDSAWPKIEQSITSQGLEIRCSEGCHECCFDLKSCSHSEGLLIDEYLQSEFSVERQEHFRSRVESAAGCFRKRRGIGVCESADELDRSGGIECPFLDRGRCSIYPVRPLSCRSMVLATPSESAKSVDRKMCRKCPASVVSLEARIKRIELQARFDEQETNPSLASLLPQIYTPSIAERLSSLWVNESDFSATHLMTSESWEQRLKSRETAFDQTWRDDGFNWEVLEFPVVLPEEGEYPPDIVVLRTKPETHEVYGEHLHTNALEEFRVLYKLLPGGRIDWEEKVFKTNENKASHILWMGDSIQERLMMWDAAVRCQGDVLCGGLGMGIFPQFALSLPQVRSVHVVDMDAAIISLIKNNWAKQPWQRQNDCSISQSPIENFLKQTDEKYDTVYIDTWDALTYDYLPHVNYLKDLANKTLKPGGEILLWGYEMMVRFALNQADHIWNRRDYFLAVDKQQLEIMERQQPLFHKMLTWFLRHAACSRDEFLTETYCLATGWKKDLGRLSLDRFGGS